MRSSESGNECELVEEREERFFRPGRFGFCSTRFRMKGVRVLVNDVAGGEEA